MIVLINKEIVFDKISKRFCGIPYFLIELPPNNKVASYYNVCDIFLPPIRSEGFYPVFDLTTIKGLTILFLTVGFTLGLAYVGNNPFIYFQF